MRLLTQPRARMAAIVAASMLAGGAMTGAAMAAQTHMLAARSYLQNARAELTEARSDKGGHRDAAIDLIDRALGEVDAGLHAGAY